MRGFLVIMLLLGGCPKLKESKEISQSMQETGVVKSEYDDFKDMTVVTYEASVGIQSERSAVIKTMAGQPVSIGIRLYAIKEAPDKGALISLNTYFNDSWRYLKCHSLDFSFDGQSFSPETEHDGAVGVGSVNETVTADIPTKTILALGASAEVKGRLCNDVFILSDGQINGLQDFARQAGMMAKPKKAAAPTSNDASEPTSASSQP